MAPMLLNNSPNGGCSTCFSSSGKPCGIQGSRFVLDPLRLNAVVVRFVMTLSVHVSDDGVLGLGV